MTVESDRCDEVGGDVEAEMLERLLRRRHSCRAFLPEPLPRATIERMLALAQRTASWCNSQPWQVIVTSGGATERLRAVLYDAAVSGAAGEPDLPLPGEYRGVYRDRRRESGFALYSAVGVERSDLVGRGRQALENFRFFGAPHAGIITSDAALGTYGVLDVGGYLASLTLSAEALGVGLVPQGALATQSRVIRDHLGIPADRVIVAGFSFGYADPEHPVNGYRTSRATVADAVRWVDE